MIRERLSRDQLLLVAGYIESASQELTDEMINADDGAEDILRRQGVIRGYRDVARRLCRVHDEK